MDTFARVVEFADWCLHCERILVECIFKIFSQVLFTLAMLACSWVSVTVMIVETDAQNFKCNWKNITCENAW